MCSDVFTEKPPESQNHLACSSRPHYFYPKEEKTEIYKKMDSKKFYKMGYTYIEYDLLLEIELRDGKLAGYYVARSINLEDEKYNPTS